MRPKTVRVLLIEDNPADADLIRLALSSSRTDFDVQCACRMSEALDEMTRGDFAVVLADLTLPDSRGLQTIRKIRERVPEIPVVVLTGVACDEVALASLDQGAQDYLVKDRITNDVLERTIRYAIQRQQNTQVRRLLKEVASSRQLLKKKNQRLAKLYKTAHQFVDNVSHEFRTPLTVVKEYSSILRDGIVGEVNAEQARMLDIIGDRADDLNHMVDDMLDVSKLESGLLCARRKTCRPEDIVRHVGSAMERKATVRGVAIDISIQDNLPDVYCDAEKAGRVIINLTVNALKFCGEPGRVQLHVVNHQDSHDVTFSVTDNGPGIEEKQRTAIFDRFKQLETDFRGSTKGFGLGLNIAKELVDLNFGQMDVDSRPGQGSTFSFTVPVDQPTVVMQRYLRRTEHVRNGSSVVSMIVARIDESVDAELADDVGEFVNHLLRHDDLIFRAGSGKWLIVLPIPESELDKFTSRAAESLNDANRNRPRGPLPQIEMQVQGTWRVSTEEKDILAQVRNVVEPLEPSHV